MNKEVINPWNWQEEHDFVHANKITGAQNIIYCAGQISVDDNGNPIGKNNMEIQLNKAFDNLEIILEKAGATLSNVVRLNYYTTDIPGFLKTGHVVSERLKKGNCHPASTLLGVASLVHPDIIIEIEATAVM